MKNIKLKDLVANKNKILWFTDLHMKPSNLHKCAQLFDFILRTALGQRCELIIFSGDMHDGKDNISVKCQNCLASFVQKIGDHNINMVMIPGNHDYEETINQSHYSDSNIFPGHSLELLDEFPNVVVINEPTMIENIAFLPFRGINAVVLTELQKMKTSRYLFAHEGVIGADLGNGRLDSFSLPSSAFKKFKRVFMGHYHKSHIIDNIVYLGSPFTQNFGEANERKHIAIIDINNNTIDLLETPVVRHTVININIEKIGSDDSVLKDLSDKEHTKLVITGDKAKINKKEKLLRQFADKAKLVLNFTDKQKNRVNIGETMTKEKMVEIYINNLATQYDKKQLFVIAKDYLKE